MKAYWCRDATPGLDAEEACHEVIHAETRGKAMASWAADVGTDFTAAHCTRLPALDGKEATAQNLIPLGWTFECADCYRMVSQTDFDDPWDARVPSYDDHGDVYCSAECRQGS